MAIQSGQRLTPARLNVRAAKATRSAVLSLTSGTITPIVWDGEDFDNASMAVASSAFITLPTSGLWGILAYAGFASNATGQRRLMLEVGSSGVFPTIDSRAATPGDVTHITLSGSYVASAGDSLRLNAQQASGGALNLLGGAYFTAWLIES